MVARSFWPQARRKVVNGLGLLARGDLGAVAQKFVNERRLKQAARFDA